MFARGTARPALIESFFQFSMIGLVASGFLALAGSGHVDTPTVVLVFAGLGLRAAMAARLVRLRFSTGIVAAVAVSYVGLYALDAFVISRDPFTATIHGVCFIALLKIITAETGRDYGYVGGIALLELLTGALISVRATFFPYLALFVFFAIATFMSSEVRTSLERFERRSASPPGVASAPAFPQLRPSGRLIWLLAGLTCAAAVFTVILAAGLFLLIPRTARAAANWFPTVPSGFVSIADQVDLGRFGQIVKDNRPVMRVRPYSRAMPRNLKWRGSALSRFDGMRWTEPPLAGMPQHRVTGTIMVADRWQRSRQDGARFVYRVDLVDAGSGTLFIAGIPEFLNVDAQRIVRTTEDSFRVTSAAPDEPLRYEVSAHTGPPLDYDLAPGERWRYLALPPIDKRIRSLARDWEGPGPDAEQAKSIESHLRSGFKYTLDTPRTASRDPLADFLFVQKAGYCEYFASAMAVMLRTVGIPARVATGFQSGYFNDVSGVYVIRASDAHAWVEAWIEGQGWRTFDPTPPDTQSRSGLFARLGMYLDAADSQWQQWVVSYDFMHQLELASKFQALLRSWAYAGQLGSGPWTWHDLRRALFWAARGLAFAVVAALIALFGPRFGRDFVRKRRLRQIMRTGGEPADARVLYESMLDLLARRGYHKPAWFTPAEFAGGLPPAINPDVVRFTSLYNEARFGRDASLNFRMAELLDKLAALPRK